MPLHIHDLIDPGVLAQTIEQKYVRKKPHESGELFIYNYSHATQYDYVWNEATRQCRGLITDKEGYVKYRPFPKFFNLSEHKDGLPDEPFDVYEKLDGTLGIIYWFEDRPYVASRGAFHQRQAIEATKILYEAHSGVFEQFDREATYLVEIIYPGNRIIVDYGARRELVGLAKLDTLTGKTLSWDVEGFTLARPFRELRSIEDVREFCETLTDGSTAEGFVLHYPQSELRVKIKASDYTRLASLVQKVSSRSIWEALKDNRDFETVWGALPDEFYNWARRIQKELTEKFSEIERICLTEFHEKATPKETGLYIQSCSYPKVLFAMLRNHDWKEVIWKTIEPEWEIPALE